MTDATPPLNLERCPSCGELVPPGAFCGNCGAALSDATPAKERLHAFAAAPHEHVLRPAIVTTLLPHLPRRHAHQFELLLSAGVFLIVILAAVRLIAPATVVAAVLLSVLYLLYLYESEVYEHEPALVLLLTFVSGAALGAAFTLVTGNLITASVGGTQQGVLISGVVLPVVAQILMVATPLLLLSRTHFDETLDGLTFGVATALGFTAATVLAGQWHLITTPLLGGVSADDILRLIRSGLLLPLVNASATGLITAALWLRVHRQTRVRVAGGWRDLEVALVIAFAAQIGLGVASYLIPSLLAVDVVYVAAAALLLVWLRLVLHFALLEEKAEFTIGPPTACAECHRLVPTMTFCPACGASRAASPKHSRPAAVPPLSAPVQQT